MRMANAKVPEIFRGAAECPRAASKVVSAGDDLQLLDVRAPDGWEIGHIPNARQFFLGNLQGRLNELDPPRAAAVYCDSGYRDSIMAFDARLAGGGTSGHGISGTMQLNPGSWITVICLFIGGDFIGQAKPSDWISNPKIFGFTEKFG